MKDERKTKKVLIEELESLRQRVKDLESDSGDGDMAEKMEKYELVLDSITDVVFQMDLDFNWTYVTPSVEKSRGYTPKEVLKQGMEEVLTPESINTVRQVLGEELAKEGMEGVDPKRTRVMELQLYHKNGSLVWVEVISTFLRDEEGRVVGLQGVSRNIEKRKEAQDEAHKSEDQYRVLFDSDEDGLIIRDMDGNLVRANPAACNMFNSSEEELIGVNVYEHVHPDSHDVVKRQFEEIRESGVFRGEGLVKRSDGSTFLGSATVSSVKFEGEPRMMTVLRDVTEARQLEVNLKESEERFSKAFENSPMMMAISNIEDGTFINVNDMFVTGTGYSKKEVIGRTSIDLDILTEEDRKALINTLSDYGIVRDFETRMRTKSGDIRDISYYAETTNIAGENKLVSTVLDITDQKESEKELERHYKLSDAFLEAIPCSAVLLKPDRAIVAVNKIGQYLGGEVGHKCYESLYGFKKPCWWCLAPELLKTGEPQHTVVEVLGMVRDTYWVPVEEDLYLHYAFDITDKIHAERKKSKLEEQLQHAQKMESLGVLAGGIAHDFNNLLMGIMGNVGMARMKTSPEAPSYAHIKQIETTAERAAELTNQMLAYSGRGKFLLRSINFTTLVEEMTHLLNTVLDKNAVLKLNLDSSIPAIEADPSQIQQVVMNLLTNASDALEGQSGFVAVSTGVATYDKSNLSRFHFGEDLAEGEYIFLEVTDNGQGIDGKSLGNIFDPFYTTKEGGRGLGLSAVIGIIKGHKGAIDVTSRPGEGTTFKILFPAGERPPEETEKEKPNHSDYMGEGTILVVDDERTVREVARSILKEFGFEVITASDGLEALEIYRENADDISLVLMDLTMPNMGGLETFRQLRNFYEDVKVILSSGFTKEDAVSEFTDAGLVDFIQKPYSPERLISTIRKALED